MPVLFARTMYFLWDPTCRMRWKNHRYVCMSILVGNQRSDILTLCSAQLVLIDLYSEKSFFFI